MWSSCDGTIVFVWEDKRQEKTLGGCSLLCGNQTVGVLVRSGLRYKKSPCTSWNAGLLLKKFENTGGTVWPNFRMSIGRDFLTREFC